MVNRALRRPIGIWLSNGSDFYMARPDSAEAFQALFQDAVPILQPIYEFQFRFLAVWQGWKAIDCVHKLSIPPTDQLLLQHRLQRHSDRQQSSCPDEALHVRTREKMSTRSGRSISCAETSE